MENEWIERKRYCPNCGALNRGHQGSDGRLKVLCPRCGLISVVRIRSRRHSSSEEYLSRYWEEQNRKEK